VAAGIILVGCTNVEVLSILGSKIMGWRFFSLEYTRATRLRLRALGLLGNLFEDLPQLIIQVYIHLIMAAFFF